MDRFYFIIKLLVIIVMTSDNVFSQDEKYIFLDTAFNVSSDDNQIICNLSNYAYNLKWNMGSGILEKDPNNNIIFTVE